MLLTGRKKPARRISKMEDERPLCTRLRGGTDEPSFTKSRTGEQQPVRLSPQREKAIARRPGLLNVINEPAWTIPSASTEMPVRVELLDEIGKPNCTKSKTGRLAAEEQTPKRDTEEPL